MDGDREVGASAAIFSAYLQKVVGLIHKQAEEQEKEMAQLVDWMTQAVRSRRRIFVFGSGHAGLLAAELFYRTGGLALICPIFVPGTMVHHRPVTATSQAERVEGYSPVWLDAADPRPEELLVAISVSGRNPAAVDMALDAQKRGLRVVGVTSVSYSQEVSSRHSSGLRLFEVADLVVDIGGPVGDAVVDIPNHPGRVGPSSTVVGAALLNAAVCQVVHSISEEGQQPPVFMSANVPGGDEHNQKLLEQYRDFLTYL